MLFLIAESELPEDRQRRRDSVGRSAGETDIDTLHELVPNAACDRVTPLTPMPRFLTPRR